MVTSAELVFLVIKLVNIASILRLGGKPAVLEHERAARTCSEIALDL